MDRYYLAKSICLKTKYLIIRKMKIILIGKIFFLKNLNNFSL